jgi:predicted TIM-barrel fold metal-dependent hydrolase
MHAGLPMVEEMIMLMNAHPQVFVDISADNWGVPRAEFHYLLKRMVQAGYGKRIMFGSDQMVWPDSLPIAVAAIEQADFLTPAQKRDIFYNNAARFLRLTPEQIAQDREAARRGAGGASALPRSARPLIPRRLAEAGGRNQP